MNRGVGLLKCPPCLNFVGGLVFDPDAVGRTEPGVVPIDFDHILVARNRPEPQSLVAFQPADRIIPSKPLKSRMRHTLGKGVVRREIGMGITGCDEFGWVHCDLSCGVVEDMIV